MRSNITTSIVVNLVLSQEEAAWLHAVMQNPIQPADPHLADSEPPHDADMRRKFWEATKPQ